MPETFATPIDARTRYCAVYGHPIKHSASPAMQNAGFSALGMNWRYLAFDVHPQDLPAALEGAKASRYIGINLTVPHKLLAVKLVDLVDEPARLWGAVNTIRFEGKDENGQWRPIGEFENAPSHVRSHGFNTDAGAIAKALEEDLEIKLAGSRVVILGAGGAGRTAAIKLAVENVAEMFLINRTEEKARTLADEISRSYPNVKVTVGYPSGQVDLMLNATSLGLKPADALPFDEAKFSISKAKAVYDMIYRPAETPLLKLAKLAGCRAANGLGMLLYQGAKALEIWTGKTAPLGIMRQALEHTIENDKP